MVVVLADNYDTPAMQDHLKERHRVHVNSIRLMAEAASIQEPTIEAAMTISEDVTQRLKQIISRALKFMRHGNRSRLTCADINKSLMWSDCQPVFGHECNPSERLRYSYVPEAQVFKYEEEIVDLNERYGKQNISNLDDLLTDEALYETVPELTIEPIVIKDDTGT